MKQINSRTGLGVLAGLVILLAAGCYTQLGSVRDDRYGTDQEQDEQYYSDEYSDSTGGEYERAYDDYNYPRRNPYFFDYYYPPYYNPWFWPGYATIIWDPWFGPYYPIYEPGWWYAPRYYGSGYWYDAPGSGRGRSTTRTIGHTRGYTSDRGTTSGTSPRAAGVGPLSTGAARGGSSAPAPAGVATGRRGGDSRGGAVRGGDRSGQAPRNEGVRSGGSSSRPSGSSRGSSGGSRSTGSGRSYTPPPPPPSAPSYSPPPSSGGSAPSGGTSSGGSSGGSVNTGARGGSRR